MIKDILHMVVWIETKEKCSRSPNVQILFSACFSISLVTVPYQQSLSHILTKIHYIETSQQKTKQIGANKNTMTKLLLSKYFN